VAISLFLWRRASKPFSAGLGGEGKMQSGNVFYRSGLWQGCGMGAATAGSNFSTVSLLSTIMVEGQLLPP
jgi:hypothetical protein